MTDPSSDHIYVYGVVTADARPTFAAAGVEGGEPPHVVTAGPVAAIVGHVSGRPLHATRAALEAHAAVLSEAAACTTVLPLRFGVVMPGDQAVRGELLEARHEQLARLLRQFAGHVELSVRAFYERDVQLREVVRDEAEIARLSAAIRDLPEAASYYDRIRLGQLTAAAAGRKRAADEQALVARLRPLAADLRLERELPERIVSNGAYLVERGRLPEFDAVLDDVARGLAGRIRIKYVGPLALHSFADLAAAARLPAGVAG